MLSLTASGLRSKVKPYLVKYGVKALAFGVEQEHNFFTVERERPENLERGRS